MYLCKNRHSNYYSRINIPKHLRLLGFPSEIRFSLHTKVRSEGLDRSLPIAIVARKWLSAMTEPPPACVDDALQQLRKAVLRIKSNGFVESSISIKSKPNRSITHTKAEIAKCNHHNKRSNEEWLEKFLAYKASDGIRHSSVQQLGARSRLFLSLITKPLSQITTKDALDFKTYLIKSNKGHKTQKETLAAIKQFVKSHTKNRVGKDLIDNVGR